MKVDAHEDTVHTENVPLLEDFTCKLCSEAFISKDSLLNHEESVHTKNVPLLEELLASPLQWARSPVV